MDEDTATAKRVTRSLRQLQQIAFTGNGPRSIVDVVCGLESAFCVADLSRLTGIGLRALSPDQRPTMVKERPIDKRRRRKHKWQVTLNRKLFNAAKNGNASEVQRLVKAGASPDAKDGGVGLAAVVMAAGLGHTAAVKALLRLGCNPNADSIAPNQSGLTALTYAASMGHGGVVGALLEHGGVKLDAVDSHGNTALMRAAATGRAAIAAQLVEAGANITLRATGGNAKGKTALQQTNNAEIAALLRATQERSNKVYAAAESGHAAEVKRLVEKGASPNSKYMNGQPVIQIAAHNGHTEVVEALLRLGCDPNAMSRAGRTALMYSAKNGHGGVVGALLKHGGVKLDAVDNNGITALMCAAWSGRPTVVAKLVEAGADTTLRVTGGDWEGRTALEVAEAEGHVEVAVLLREARMALLRKAPTASKRLSPPLQRILS